MCEPRAAIHAGCPMIRQGAVFYRAGERVQWAGVDNGGSAAVRREATGCPAAWDMAGYHR